MSSVISFKLQRSLFKNSPLAEKTRSDSTDVGGTNKSADRICFTLSVSSLPKYKCHTWRVARIPIPSQLSTTQGQLMNVSAEWTKRNYLKCYF